MIHNIGNYDGQRLGEAAHFRVQEKVFFPTSPLSHLEFPQTRPVGPFCAAERDVLERGT